MKLEWIIDSDRQPACNKYLSKITMIKCELPWDHIVSRNYTSTKLDYHTGRNRVGTWISWIEEVEND